MSSQRPLKIWITRAEPGAATAQAAREAGFRRVLSADGDVNALADGIAARRSEIGGAVLHPGAAELAGDLAGALARAGVEVRALTLYDTAPTALGPDQVAGLGEVDVALVHSAKGAQALAAVLAVHPQPRLKVLGLSKAVLAPLAGIPLAGLTSAPFPLEAALLNLIDHSA